MNRSHIIGIFDDEYSLIKTVDEIRGQDIHIEEVFTPFPVHEVIHAMGKKSYLQVAAYFYGLFGWRFKPPFGALYFIVSSDRYEHFDPEFEEIRSNIAFLKLTYPLIIL